jgi:hypothetical protein
MPREAALIVGEGELAGPSPSADARLMVVDAVTELLETLCSDGPVILVLEDLHWPTSRAWAPSRRSCTIWPTSHCY